MGNCIQVIWFLQVSKLQSLISPVKDKIELELKKGVHLSNFQNVQEVNLQNYFSLVGGNVIFIQGRSRVVMKIWFIYMKFTAIKLIRTIWTIMFSITSAGKISNLKKWYLVFLYHWKSLPWVNGDTGTIITVVLRFIKACIQIHLNGSTQDRGHNFP